MVGPEKIQIIGIGDDGLDGLTAQARRLIEQAELLLGDEATLALVPGMGGGARNDRRRP